VFLVDPSSGQLVRPDVGGFARFVFNGSDPMLNRVFCFEIPALSSYSNTTQNSNSSASASATPSPAAPASMTSSMSASPAPGSSPTRSIRINGTTPDRCWSLALWSDVAPNTQIVDMRVRVNGSPDMCWPPMAPSEVSLNALVYGQAGSPESSSYLYDVTPLKPRSYIDLTLLVSLSSVRFYRTQDLQFSGEMYPLYTFNRRDQPFGRSRWIPSVPCSTCRLLTLLVGCLICACLGLAATTAATVALRAA